MIRTIPGRMTAALTMALLAPALLALSSCSGDKDANFLERMFDLEERAMKNAPPSSVEELREAIREYGDEAEKTAQAMADHAGYWRLLAFKLMDRGLYGEAYDAAITALRSYPTNTGLYYVVGVSSGNLAKAASVQVQGAQADRLSWLMTAEQAYLEALELDPRYGRGLYGLAVLYTYEMDRHAEAASFMERYLEINTRDADGFLVYGRALYGAGRLEDAVDAFDKVLEFSTVEDKKALAAENKKLILDELYDQ